MKKWTYLEARTQVEDELDLHDESFISTTEMMGYFNRAVGVAEALIHDLGAEDEYFTKDAPLALVNGQADYALPSDIYANKIRAVVYNDGLNHQYEIKRVRGPKVFLDAAITTTLANASPIYRYRILNPDATTGMQMKLVPASKEDSTTHVTLSYIREALAITADTDPVDIPEFATFTIQYVKNCCREKEGTLTDGDKASLQAEKDLMIQALSEMVPDGDNEIVPDFTHYNDHS